MERSCQTRRNNRRATMTTNRRYFLFAEHTGLRRIVLAGAVLIASLVVIERGPAARAQTTAVPDFTGVYYPVNPFGPPAGAARAGGARPGGAGAPAAGAPAA